MDHVQQSIFQVRDYFRAGTLANYQRGDIIAVSNQRLECVYYVAAGFIRTYSVNSRGEEYTHIIYGPGDVFPLSWLTAHERLQVSFQCLINSEIYAVPINRFDRDLRANADLTYGFLQLTVEQYRVYSLRVDNLEYKYASERLAYRLILLANRFGERSGEAITILPPMTHQLLGSSLNLSRESVSREMEKLIRRGLVRYNASRQIILPDIKALSTQLQVPLHQGLA